MIGVKTIGNATLIAFDRVPVLATDPWLSDTGAYFGSWQLPYAIPDDERRDILACPYILFTHGHPDHLNSDSLEVLRGKTVLLPDHAGGRLLADLQSLGFDARVLRDREWVQLSDNVRLCCHADYNQDAVVLLDVAGRLFVDLNDASDRGWGHFVRSTVKRYEQSYLLQLVSCGEVDMINFHDEAGRRTPPPGLKRADLGARLAYSADLYGVTHVIPFSCFHRYQRADSVWANEYVAPLETYRNGFDSKRATLLSPFVEVDCRDGRVREINPPPSRQLVLPAEAFGDNWADPLERDDVRRLEAYFHRKERLRRYLGVLTFRVGGRDHTVALDRRRTTGITFEVPRHSLMAAVEYEVFDDLLIGNFMKTTLHGLEGLSPAFSPIVAKYADNGRAQSAGEVRAYLREYARRIGHWRFFVHVLERESRRGIRRSVSRDSLVFTTARRGYLWLKAGRAAS